MLLALTFFLLGASACKPGFYRWVPETPELDKYPAWMKIQPEHEGDNSSFCICPWWRISITDDENVTECEPLSSLNTEVAKTLLGNVDELETLTKATFYTKQALACSTGDSNCKGYVTPSPEITEATIAIPQDSFFNEASTIPTTETGEYTFGVWPTENVRAGEAPKAFAVDRTFWLTGEISDEHPTIALSEAPLNGETNKRETTVLVTKSGFCNNLGAATVAPVDGVVPAFSPTVAFLERCVCAPGVFGRSCEDDRRECFPKSDEFFRWWHERHIKFVEPVEPKDAFDAFGGCNHGICEPKEDSGHSCKCLGPWKKYDPLSIINEDQTNKFLLDENASNRCVVSACLTNPVKDGIDLTAECSWHGKCTQQQELGTQTDRWVCICEEGYGGHNCEISQKEYNTTKFLPEK